MNKEIMKMRFFELFRIEFKKVKRSKIIPLIFIAPLLVVGSGVASLHSYFTPEYTHTWAAMFIQSALIYAYYLLPLSMIVICVMIAGRETSNNGILKMLALPVSRYAISAAKFCVLLFYLLMEMVVFFAVFVIAGLFATSSTGVTETLPIMYLLKWCLDLFLTMIPSVIVMWAITVLFEKSIRWIKYTSCNSWRINSKYSTLDSLSLLLQRIYGLPLSTCSYINRIRKRI